MISLHNDIEWNVMGYVRSAARSIPTNRKECYFVGGAWLVCTESYNE